MPRIIDTEVLHGVRRLLPRKLGRAGQDPRPLAADRLTLSPAARPTADPVYRQLVQRFRSGSWTAADNVLAHVDAPAPGSIPKLPPKGSAGYRRLAAIGQQALDRGEVGLVVLTGGMATRFGWDQPKGLFPILDGTSFLGWKLKMAKAAGGEHLPVFLMTSFHTDGAVADHLAAHGDFGLAPGQVQRFEQGRFRRLTPDAHPFESPGGTEDYAAPGHGDLASALQQSGLLDRFRKDGGKTLLVSNVDNLGANPDPAVIGYHLTSGRAMTAEVAAKAPGDKGGVPALVDGKLQLVEGFALPKTFDQDRVPVFNTANYLIQADALDRGFDLPWYLVEKQVGGQPVIQFEHLAGDLSAKVTDPAGRRSFGVVEVPRDERFIPVKGQDDLPLARTLIGRKVGDLGLRATTGDPTVRPEAPHPSADSGVALVHRAQAPLAEV